jgi:tRNA-specific 2-thiouridylase
MEKKSIKFKNLKKGQKIVVAMSGGVDSSVAAALLKKQGYFVIGIFMKFWKDGSDGKNKCCSVESENMARLISKQLEMPFYVLNVEKEFKNKVVDYFIEEYKKGKTPNPCVVCNKEIKFGFLIKKALSLGAEFMATGHYAQIKNNKLLKGKDKEKDQSYFLWQLDQNQLSRVLFPVGEYVKAETRKLAKKFKLAVAETPESQEVCFVKDSTNNFLKKYLKTNPGNILDIENKKVGTHEGLWFYTIGQRKGIGLSGGPYFVVDKDFKKNNLIVSKNHKDLLKKEMIVGDVNWITPQKLPILVDVKIRYRSNLAKAKIFEDKNKKIKVVFQKPQKAITQGQSAVFYKGKAVFGGGVIF